MTAKLVRKCLLLYSNASAENVAVSLRSTEAFNEPHNPESRNASHLQQNRHLSRATANLSMPQHNAFNGPETDSGEKEIKMNDLESYLPAVAGE